MRAVVMRFYCGPLTILAPPAGVRNDPPMSVITRPAAAEYLEVGREGRITRRSPASVQRSASSGESIGRGRAARRNAKTSRRHEPPRTSGRTGPAVGRRPRAGRRCRNSTFASRALSGSSQEWRLRGEPTVQVTVAPPATRQPRIAGGAAGKRRARSRRSRFFGLAGDPLYTRISNCD